MSASVELREPKDLTRINVDDALEVHWWCAKFAVTPEALRAAVDEHGPSAEEVREKLRAAAKVALKNSGED